MSKRINMYRLRETFQLINGELFRVNKASGKVKKVESNANLKSGYCAVGFDGGMYHMSRIVLALHRDEDIPDGMHVRHIDGDMLNNHPDNLEICDSRTISQNRKCHREGRTAGVKYEGKDRYTAYIGIGKRLVHLGTLKTEKEAGELYRLACEHTDEYDGDGKEFRKLLAEIKYEKGTKPIGKY